MFDKCFTSLFGETWSSEFLSSVTAANFLNDVLRQTSLNTDLERSTNKLGRRLRMVARLMQAHKERGVDRDMFFVDSGGSWDHHGDVKLSLSGQLGQLNEGLRQFVAELKSQGLWDNVALVVTSEFGRTMTPNGRQGCDHGWGGHYAVLGGNVKGGRILGQYPSDLTETGPYSISRGRYMPTTSWESIWNGVSEWMGVEDPTEMEYILPNLGNIQGENFYGPFSKSEMFHTADKGVFE